MISVNARAARSLDHNGSSELRSICPTDVTNNSGTSEERIHALVPQWLQKKMFIGGGKSVCLAGLASWLIALLNYL